MKIINYKDIDETFYQKIDLEALDSVDKIIKEIKQRGDSALIELSEKFGDGLFKTSENFLVSKDEIKESYKKVDPKIIEALKVAIKNVEDFSRAQLNSIKELKYDVEGSTLGHKIVPLDRVLCYCPGGNYPLLSSCYMTVVPAVVAGVKEVCLTSPKITPEVIVSADMAGANKIYRLGGAQAIAAFGHGTESIEAVDKIVGPGNKFVAAAKKSVYGSCDIDFIAGPSEVLIIADDINDSKFIAADMLAQCEHDRDARAYLITDDINLARKVEQDAKEFLKTLETRDIAEISFEKSICIIVDKISQAIEITNKRAPEHLELFIKDAEKLKDKFTNYGSLFIGRNCAEVFGDYCSGTNHVLPTNSASKYTGGLSVFDYVKILSYQCLNQKYALKLSKVASTLAGAEGLFAHKLASDLRGDRY